MPEIFTREEYTAILAVCNGTIFQPAGVIRGGVLADVEDSLDSEITVHGADKEALVAKLRTLSPLQQYALVESIESYWDNLG
jgi:hypothetical protein